jgi:hypothetical protein
MLSFDAVGEGRPAGRPFLLFEIGALTVVRVIVPRTCAGPVNDQLRGTTVCTG